MLKTFSVGTKMDRRKLIRSALMILPIVKSPLLLASFEKSVKPALKTKAFDDIISPNSEEVIADNSFKVLIEVNRYTHSGQSRDQVKSEYIKGSIQDLNKKYLNSGRMLSTQLTHNPQTISWEYSFTSRSEYQAWQKELSHSYIDYKKAHAMGLKERVTILNG